MKLLIFTQKVDKNDPILGFFHRWIEEFANHCDQLTVICLQAGKYDLPANVRVVSLGKEKKVSRLRYILNFYRYLWRERKNYDTVFVHMNQEYILLGGMIWRMSGKKILFWRNHPHGSFRTRLAVLLSDRVFCTSDHSFTARFAKTKIMPAGIDTELFKRDPLAARKPKSILFLGRMSPIKKPEVLIETLHLLDERGVDFTAGLVGDPLPKDEDYYQNLRDLVHKYQLEGKVRFVKAVPPGQAAAYYNSYEIFVNLTPTGSMDKTIFEAMACECLAVVSNQALTDLKNINEALICAENNAYSLAGSLKHFLSLDTQEKETIMVQLRKYAEDRHGLERTILGVINSI